jgi:SAM-dependent methyltransferase
MNENQSKLVTSNGYWGKGRWFLCDEESRRHVLETKALKSTRFESVTPENVSDDFLLSRSPQSPISRSRTLGRIIKTKSSLEMRELATTGLVGSGIEFGAGASPLAVPYGANVKFADTYSYEELITNRYPGQDLNEIVKPEIILSFDKISDLGVKNSLDFIIACHVIEHVANPVKAIIDSLNVLKPGGKIVLIVPDMRKTFDRDRKLTEISHLMLDFQAPSRERDFNHFLDFYTLAMPLQDPSRAPEIAKENHLIDFPIHYHTFTHKSFRKLLAEVQLIKHVSFDFWIEKARYTEVDIEFYVQITKKW